MWIKFKKRLFFKFLTCKSTRHEAMHHYYIDPRYGNYNKVKARRHQRLSNIYHYLYKWMMGFNIKSKEGKNNLASMLATNNS